MDNSLCSGVMHQQDVWLLYRWFDSIRDLDGWVSGLGSLDGIDTPKERERITHLVLEQCISQVFGSVVADFSRPETQIDKCLGWMLGILSSTGKERVRIAERCIWIRIETLAPKNILMRIDSKYLGYSRYFECCSVISSISEVAGKTHHGHLS
jgi:hypothetical protein